MRLSPCAVLLLLTLVELTISLKPNVLFFVVDGTGTLSLGPSPSLLLAHSLPVHQWTSLACQALPSVPFRSLFFDLNPSIHLTAFSRPKPGALYVSTSCDYAQFRAAQGAQCPVQPRLRLRQRMLVSTSQ
jgi:hypothetical protein